MMKNLLSRLMGATKRKLTGAKRQRSLAFERMEDRLALSTSTGTEVDLQIYWTATTQGGPISLSNADEVRYYLLDFRGAHYQFADFDGVGSLAGVFTSGLSVSEAYASDGANSRDFDSAFVNSWNGGHKLTIAQPLYGNAEISNGIVAVGAIFETQPFAKGSQESTVNVAVAKHQAEPQLAPAIVPVNEVLLARGRDMYFDVAEVSADESSSRQGDEKDQAVLTRVSFNSFGSERERVRTASPTMVPTGNAAKAFKARGTQSDDIRSSESAESLLNAVPTVSEAELPALPQESSPQGEKVSATNARDQAFSDWQHRELLDSEEILSARTDESDEDSSSWPILAALAVGGLVVRSRRLAGSSLWHQQPPNRKKSANL